MNNTELVVNNNPKSSFSEAIKSVRTNLQFSMVDKTTKTILVTSPEPSDGKSFISANLAVAFTQENKKVLLVDSDLRKGRQHRLFRVKNDRTKGYSNLIVSSKTQATIDDFIIHTEVRKLDLLPCGAFPPNPSELLSSINNRELVEKLKKMYDIIIFDCAPTLGLNDSLVMTKLTDINIVVVSKEKTKIEALEEVKHNFEKVNAKIDGVVLNKVTQKDISYYGYYGE